MQIEGKWYFCTNTKMSKGLKESLDYIKRLEDCTEGLHGCAEIAVMLPFTALYPAILEDRGGRILLGAQNVSAWDETAYTGEISAAMLEELGAGCVLTGHSERRYKLGETDEEIRRKTAGCLRRGMTVFLSISETQREKEANVSDEVLRMQLKRCLYGIRGEETDRLRILYEPQWAIGRAPSVISAEYAGERHLTIRETLTELFGTERGSRIPLLYGGSVTAENAPGLAARKEINGLGIGRSAWDAENFGKIIRAVIDSE